MAEEKIKQYESDRNGIVEFKKELAEFANSLAKSENKKAPLVFFIDELDRCKPDFAITLLERIKHVFNVGGIVFVLCIDREQVEESVRTIYGQKVKTDAYLRRFIDFKIRLPVTSVKSFCEFLFERFHMSEVMVSRPNNKDEIDTLLRVFSKLAEEYQLTLRVIEQCFTEINLILRTTKETTKLHPDILAILVVLRAAKVDMYNKVILKQNYSQLSLLVSEFKKNIDMNDSLCKTISAVFEANLIYSNLEKKQIISIYNENLKIADNQLTDKENKEYANRFMEILESFDRGIRQAVSIDFISSRLDAVKEIMA